MEDQSTKELYIIREPYSILPFLILHQKIVIPFYDKLVSQQQMLQEGYHPEKLIELFYLVKFLCFLLSMASSLRLSNSAYIVLICCMIGWSFFVAVVRCNLLAILFNIHWNIVHYVWQKTRHQYIQNNSQSNRENNKISHMFCVFLFYFT